MVTDELDLCEGLLTRGQPTEELVAVALVQIARTLIPWLFGDVLFMEANQPDGAAPFAEKVGALELTC